MKDEPIKNELRELINQARKKGVWLFCQYQGLWFSPTDLERANADGRFLWGAVNWNLRDPQEHLNELRRKVENAKAELLRFEQKLASTV